jgi:hypothetical protein
VNAAAYQETLKRLKEAIWQKRPGYWPKEFLLCNTVLNLTVLLQPWIFWTHESGRFFHIHQAVLICSVRLSPPRSALSLHWICSKQSQEQVTCLVHIFVYKELDKLMSLWYVSKQTLWLCGVVKLIWDCVWAWSITLYVVILCK